MAVTFFGGSILFTIGGALQSVLAHPDRRRSAGGRAAWWTAIVQSAGTLFFNVTTAYALHVTSRARSTTGWSGDPTRWGRCASWSPA